MRKKRDQYQRQSVASSTPLTTTGDDQLKKETTITGTGENHGCIIEPNSKKANIVFKSGIRKKERREMLFFSSLFHISFQESHIKSITLPDRHPAVVWSTEAEVPCDRESEASLWLLSCYLISHLVTLTHAGSVLLKVLPCRITREHVRNANSQLPPQTEPESLVCGPKNLCFNKILTLEFENHGCQRKSIMS